MEELLQRFSLWVAMFLSYLPKNSPRSSCPRTAAPRCALENCSAYLGEKGWGPGYQQIASCLPRTRLQLGMAFRGQEQRYWTFLCLVLQTLGATRAQLPEYHLLLCTD